MLCSGHSNHTFMNTHTHTHTLSPSLFKQGIKEQGKILRQGDLTVVELSKHRRRVFLFEDAIILSKKRKPKHQHHDIPGSEYFDFKAVYKVFKTYCVLYMDY